MYASDIHLGVFHPDPDCHVSEILLVVEGIEVLDSYTDNGLKKDWYITADLRVQFADAEKAKAFKESMAAKAQVEDEIEETNGKFFVTVKSVTFPVAENADFYGKDVYEQIVEEINDPTYKALAFNAENQLTGFDTGAEVPDYY